MRGPRSREPAFPDRQSLRPQKHALGETRFEAIASQPSDLVFWKGAGRQPQSISTVLFVFKVASRFLAIYNMSQFSSVQSLSRVRLFATP